MLGEARRQEEVGIYIKDEIGMKEFLKRKGCSRLCRAEHVQQMKAKKASLHGQFYLPAPCLPSTADKNGDEFTRQTCDLNKLYSCVELSCVGGEFRVQH